MQDYPLLSISQVAFVDDISFFGGAGGRGVSLDIQGREFSGTSAVLINGHRSPTYVVISDSRLLADIPTAVLGESIKTLNVLKVDATTAGRGSVISFEAVSSSAEVPSSSFLVQKVLKYLFTTTGSDIFSPTSGGNLLSLVGGTESSAGSLSSYARIYVRQAVDSLIRDQGGSSSPLAEKVQTVEVLEASYSRIHTSLDIRLAIVSMTGQRVVAGLSV
jgi:hypothetical protein